MSRDPNDRWCQHCGSRGNLVIHSRNGNRISYMCNPCNTARSRAYRATTEGHERVNSAVRRWREKNVKKRSNEA